MAMLNCHSARPWLEVTLAFFYIRSGKSSLMIASRKKVVTDLVGSLSSKLVCKGCLVSVNLRKSTVFDGETSKVEGSQWILLQLTAMVEAKGNCRKISSPDGDSLSS